MNESLLNPVDRARKTVQCVLQALASSPASAIATASGMTESTISRLKNEHLRGFAVVLAHAGLKIVPADKQCFDPEYVKAIQTLAQAELNRQALPPQLSFD